jgi:hypothetical protein
MPINITPRTRSVDLFRLMYASEDIHPDNRTDEQQNAHIEWERRLEACALEHGSCYNKMLRYEAYCEGREDEKRINGGASSQAIESMLNFRDWAPSND